MRKIIKQLDRAIARAKKPRMSKERKQVRIDASAEVLRARKAYHDSLRNPKISAAQREELRAHMLRMGELEILLED